MPSRIWTEGRDWRCPSPSGSSSSSSPIFDVEQADILYSAAEMLDAGDVKNAFDAVHVADAMHRGGRLHTADDELLRSELPTLAF